VQCREGSLSQPSQKLGFGWRSGHSCGKCAFSLRASAPRCRFGLLQYDRTVVIKSGPKTKLQLLHSQKLAQFPWLVQAFSTRHGGVSRVYGGNSLNLGITKHDSRAAVERNRGLFLKEVGVADKRTALVTLRQIHSDLIHRIEGVPKHPLTGDGLITDTPGLLLAILTADCLPVILVDKKNRVVGVFHAGWRGTVKRIVEKGVGEMQRYFGSDPRNLVAAIGPGVQACCYQVGEEVRQRFEAQFAYGAELFREVKESDPVREKYPMLFLTARAPGHSELPVNLYLDLVEANRRQLVDAGVPAKNIDASSPCTACRTDLLFSHRAEKGVTGRLMAVVGVRTGHRG
jgi:polyphenol oxidase